MTRRLNKGEEVPYDLLLLADETREAINKYIFDSEVFVYELKDQTIAAYAICPIDQETIELKNIAVHPLFQNKGIGKALMKDVARNAQAKGFKTLIVGTGDVMIMQLRFYQQAGFEMYALKPNFYIQNYPEPVYENGLQLRHMVMFKKSIEGVSKSGE